MNAAADTLPALALDAASVQRGGRTILHRLSLSFTAPGLTAIIGPNGAGKSTLLRLLAGLETPDTGSVSLAGQPRAVWNRQQWARTIGYVPQSVGLEFGYTVTELVALGRGPHLGGVWESPADRRAITAALARTNLTALADRDIQTLSGGERQRVLLAAAVAQAAPILLLDEPSTFLDVRHQWELLQLLQEFAAEGRNVILATHEWNLLATAADRILLLHHGSLLADGAPAAVLTPDNIQTAFEVPACVVSREGRLHVYLGGPWDSH